MTGKSRPPGPLADRMDRAQTTHEHECSRGARCSVFKDRCVSSAGLAALHAWARPGPAPEGPGNIARCPAFVQPDDPPRPGRALGSAQAQAPEAPLARLQDLPVELGRRQIE